MAARRYLCGIYGQQLGADAGPQSQGQQGQQDHQAGGDQQDAGDAGEDAGEDGRHDADGRLLVDDTPDGLIARSRYHDAVTLVVDHPEQVASALSELLQARKVELREGELTVFPREGQRLLEVITDVIRGHGWSVSELRLEAGRLDEVFRQVTKGEVS